jgi:hypothetical protein
MADGLMAQFTLLKTWPWDMEKRWAGSGLVKKSVRRSRTFCFRHIKFSMTMDRHNATEPMTTL